MGWEGKAEANWRSGRNNRDRLGVGEGRGSITTGIHSFPESVMEAQILKPQYASATYL